MRQRVFESTTMSLRRLSNASRTLSASSLKDRLSMLTTTPLVPVATALQANIEFVLLLQVVSR